MKKTDRKGSPPARTGAVSFDISQRKLWLILYVVLLALGMTVTTGRMSLVLLGVALVLTLLPGGLASFRANLSLPVVGFLAYGLVNGIMAVFADTPSGGLKELYKFLAAFGISVLLLGRFRKEQAEELLWSFTGVGTLVGLMGIDAACEGFLFHLFSSLMHLFRMEFDSIDRVMDGRINGIYNDPNVTGGLLAVVTLLALYLLSRAEDNRRQLIASLLLGISAMSFFLSMSRGAILCFGLALLVWLVATGKDRRMGLFLLIFCSAVATILCSIPAVYLIRHGSMLATFCTLLCSALIWLLNRTVVERFAEKLSQHTKAAAVTACVLVLAFVVYGVAAVHITGASTVLPTDVYRRAVSLEPGSYTVTGDWDGNPQVTIQVRPQRDVAMQRWNDAYTGPLMAAAFEVPADTAQIQIQLTVEEATEVREVVFSDGTKLNLGYPLLPAFVADRIQDGLFTSANVLQRFQFMKDGLKIFASSPVVGHGLGSTELLYTSVQPYFYETLFVHNHVIQILCDTGVVGLTTFLLLMVGVLVALLRRLKEKRDPLAALLLACWVMINTHSLLEINFSIRGYQVLIYPILLLTAMLYAKPIKDSIAKTGGLVAAVFVWVYIAVFGGLILSTRSVNRQMESFDPVSPDAGMQALAGFASRDVFGREQHKLNYIGNAIALGEEPYLLVASKYAAELDKSVDYRICSGLARYYYLPTGNLEGLFEASRRGIAQEASAKESWNLQLDFYRTEVLSIVTEKDAQTYLEGVLETKAYLESYSADHWEHIVLSEENVRFLAEVSYVEEQGLSDSAALTLLKALNG